jgi:hypothetical protein
MFFKPARGHTLLQEGPNWGDPGFPDSRCFRGAPPRGSGFSRCFRTPPRSHKSSCFRGAPHRGSGFSDSRRFRRAPPKRLPDSSCFRRAPPRSRLSGPALLQEGSTWGSRLHDSKCSGAAPPLAPSCFRTAPSGAGPPYIPAFLNRGNYRGCFQNIVILICVLTLERVNLNCEGRPNNSSGSRPILQDTATVLHCPGGPITEDRDVASSPGITAKLQIDF